MSREALTQSRERYLFFRLVILFKYARSVAPIGAGVGAGWTFSCSSEQGAIMVAPDGATLTEVLQEKRFLRSIESVASWFKYAEEEEQRCFKSLILVTGVIKCRSWSVAAISNTSRTNSGKVTISLMPMASGTLTASHSWGNHLSDMGHSGPTPSSQSENQCVFVRGYRIMRQNPVLRLKGKVKAIDLREGTKEYYKLGKPTGSEDASSSSPSQGQQSTSTRSLPSNATTTRDSDVDSAIYEIGDYMFEQLPDRDEVCFHTPPYLFI